MFKNVVAAHLAIFVVASAGCATHSGPTAGPLSPTSDSIIAALQSGCLPFLVEGGTIYDRLKGHSARDGEINGKHAARLFGNGDVQIQESEQGGCYLVASGAFRNTQVTDAAAFRQTVLDLIPRIAGPMVARFDSGPGFSDPVGEFRQEGYCFALRGKPAWLVLSTSTTRPTALQASVGWDRENEFCTDKLPVGA
jgi:hypothetical protein